MQDSWSSLIPFLLLVFVVIFFILWLCWCIQAIESKMDKRTNELINEINLIENGQNGLITDTDDLSQYIQVLGSRIERTREFLRIHERIDETNFIENRNTADDFTQRRIEPRAPLEEIYSIENATNMYRTDTNPPPYSDIIEKEMNLDEPPPSYLESFKVSKFNTLV